MRNDVPQAKLAILAVVMIAILAVSVALAYLVTKPGKSNSPGGAEIISKLASDTIEGYWTGSRRQSWFIMLNPNAQPVGWQMSSRGRESEGIFSGSLVDGSIGASRHRSTWRTKTDLSESIYTSRGPANKAQMADTRIELTDSEVTVVRIVGGRKRSATAPRPANYVPEGTFPLVLRLAAAGARPVTIKMIVDQYAIVDGKINFVDISLMPLGDNVVRAVCSRRRVMPTTVYHLDSEYNVYQRVYPTMGIIYRLCEKELVTKTFRIIDDQANVKFTP